MRLSNEDVLFRWPLAQHIITAGWLYNDGSLHRALDFRAAVGTPVYAAEGGTVETAYRWNGKRTQGDTNSYGNMVKLRHATYKYGTLETLYAHLSKLCVAQGQQVQEGQLIGYSGDTGNCYGAHLHFEVRWKGQRTNPLNWLDNDFRTANSAVKLGSYSSVKNNTKEVKRMYYAIDVSKHQGRFDWQAAYNKGIRHAMLRAGYGRYSSQKDPQFERNAAECARLGIQYGVYWYSYASTPAEARQEARCCLTAIKGKHLCLPVAYDIEYEPCILRLTNAQRTALVQAFLSEIEAAGYYGILYASCGFIRNRLDFKALSKYDIWVAQYGSTCTCPLPYGIWQYSSRNALGIPGYGTSLDCNRIYKDYERMMIQAGLQGHTAPPPEDTTPNKLDKQRITIGRISSGDRSTIRALCDGLGLVAASLYRETCADGNLWTLDIGPVSSGDAWYIMRKCSELQLIDAGLYKSEYVE